MSYLFLRTASFKSGASMMAGMPLAGQVVELLVGTYKVDARLIVPAWSGRASRVSWVMKGDTLNGFFQNLGGIQTDEKYKTILTKLAEHLDGSVAADQIWRQVPSAAADKPMQGRFTHVRSVSFKNLNAMAAGLPILKEMTDYVYRTAEAASRLYVPVANGPVCRALMVRRGDDLDQAQETMDKVMNDKKCREFLARLSDFVDGSKTEDTLWRSA
jgi:hypothetical protein